MPTGFLHVPTDFFKLERNAIKTAPGFGRQFAKQLLKRDLIFGKNLDHFFKTVQPLAVSFRRHVSMLAQRKIASLAA